MQKRKSIRAICEREHTGYISLPKNPFSTIHKKGSYSHGLAMTWLYHNFIRLRQPTIFGFIDHDLFPTQPYAIAEKLGHQDFYGRLIQRGEKSWYLWAGYCFFSYQKVKKYSLNFLPCKIGGLYHDTGGSNYPILYSRYQQSELSFSEPASERAIRAGGSYHADFVQYIDGYWMHTINGSNWAKVKSKDDILKSLLNSY
jgi:hypothetical protein